MWRSTIASTFDSLEATLHEPPYREPPEHLVLYYKPRNTWSSIGARVDIPAGERLVVGASIGAVIGKRLCRVGAGEAMDYVGGYCLVHDFSLPETSYYRPDIKGKCLDGSAPVGSASAVSDPTKLAARLEVGGELRATIAVASLRQSIGAVLSEISYIMTLEPGETVAIGFNGERVPVVAGDEVTTTCDGLPDAHEHGGSCGLKRGRVRHDGQTVEVTEGPAGELIAPDSDALDPSNRHVASACC